MFRSVLRRSCGSFEAEMRLVVHGCAPSQKRKVTVLGAVQGIGMPLSLLAANPLVSSLALYDSEIQICVDEETQAQSTPFTVRAYKGEEQLGEALEGSDIVMIPAYVPRKPGMTHDHLFKISAGIVKSHCEAVAKYCPSALVNVIGNPVYGMVPIAAEVLKSKGVYDERKLFGVTTRDVYTARRLYAAKANVDCADVDVPVIGGHAGITTLPLFSQATPSANLSHEEIVALTKTTQDMAAVDEAKIGFRSARASVAYAGSMFAYACLQGLNGVPDVVACSFVQSTVTDLPFFASKVRLGKKGVEEVLGLGPMSDFEKQALEALKPELKRCIEKGIAFVGGGN